MQFTRGLPPTAYRSLLTVFCQPQKVRMKTAVPRQFGMKRCHQPLALLGGNGRAIAARQQHGDDWTGHTRAPHPRLERAWSELISSSAGRLPEHAPELDMAREAPSQLDDQAEAQAPEHGADPGRAPTHDDDDDLSGGALAVLLLAVGGAVAAVLFAALHNNDLNFNGDVTVVSPTK